MNGLSQRLTIGLFCVQSVALLTVIALFISTTSELSPNGMSHDRAMQILSQAAIAGNAERIAPTPELQAYLAGHPSLLFGVACDGLWLEGSTYRFSATTSRNVRMDLVDGWFTVPIGGRMVEGLAVQTNAEVAGRTATLLIVTVGNVADLNDIITYFTALISQIGLLLIPVFVMTLAASIVIVRVSLRPLNRIASDAQQIDLDQLDLRIDDKGTPSEILPLTRSFNHLLGRLQKSYGARRRFFDDAAHELRTPIAIIRNRIDDLPRTPTRELLIRDIRRLSALSDQLLASARMNWEAAEQKEPVDLAAISRETVADLAPLGHALGVAIEWSSALEKPVVPGNAAALTSLLANLISNALKFEPEGGVVSVRLEQGPKLVVEDHGPGLTAADADMAFEPFWSGKDAGSGTGLGLAIVREVARHHGARVAVGQTDGGGARFTVDFAATSDVTSVADRQVPRPAGT